MFTTIGSGAALLCGFICALGGRYLFRVHFDRFSDAGGVVSASSEGCIGINVPTL